MICLEIFLGHGPKCLLGINSTDILLPGSQVWRFLYLLWVERISDLTISFWKTSKPYQLGFEYLMYFKQMWQYLNLYLSHSNQLKNSVSSSHQKRTTRKAYGSKLPGASTTTCYGPETCSNTTRRPGIFAFGCLTVSYYAATSYYALRFLHRAVKIRPLADI